MGNQNHAHAASGNAANEFQHRLNFRDGQRGGGFIHNQHFRVKGRRAGDGNGLTLAAGEISHQQAGIRNRDPESFKHLPGVGVHFGLVEKGDTEDRFHRLAAHKQIARDVDRVAQRQILVDHLDMAAARIGRISELLLFAVDANRAAGGDHRPREYFGQGGFPRAVIAHQAQHLARSQLEIDSAQ